MSEPTPDDVRGRWDALAGYWDSEMEAGRTWQRELIAPVVERLLGLAPGERVVELACGNGELSRRMADLGATVVASDFSEAMLERARARGGPVAYRRVDATDAAEVAALGDPGSFDAAVANMAVMDMTSLAPMAEGVAGLVRPGGRFVVSTVHPAFNSGVVVRVTEQYDDHRGVVREHSVKRSTYLTPTTDLGVALEGQPVTQWYFHRPLELLLDPFFSAGWVVDALAEPALPSNPLFAEIPGVMVIRFRAPGEPATGR
jgi:2-polyprenyl-3-methyl-5-hydroxy-6-metoxy-1,4-benzoquinol methylase